MTDISPETQKLIDEAIRRDRERRAGVAVPAVSPEPAPEPAPRIVTSSPAVAATLGRQTDFEAAMESLKRQTVVEFRDTRFDVEPADAWLVDFTELLAQGRVRPALIMAIGEDQYDAFAGLDPRPGMIDHLALAQRISEAVRSGDS